jgi:DNA uptake protein ComE-like DNA-binding protein
MAPVATELNPCRPACGHGTLPAVSSRGRESTNPADAWLPEGVEPATPDDGESSGDAGAKSEPTKKRRARRRSAAQSQWLADPAAPPPPVEEKARVEEKAPTEESAPVEPARAAKAAEPEPNGDRQETPKPPPAKPSGPSAEERKLRKRVEQLEDEVASARKDLSAIESGGPKLRASQRLEKAQQTIKEQKEEREELAKRIRDLQSELQRESKRADAELKQRVAEREAKLTEDFAARESELSEQIATLTAQLESTKGELADAKKAKPRATRRRATKASAKPAARRRAASSRSNGELDVNEASFEELRNLGLSVTQSARLIAYRDVRGGYKSLDELDDIPGLSEATKVELRGRLTLGR